MIFLTALVFAATHPGSSNVTQDPLAFGVYYDPVNFLSDDGAHLAQLLLERSYKLCQEDYAEVARIEAEIKRLTA